MRVLHIVAGLDTGGVAMLLDEYFVNLRDVDIQFDFIIHDNPKLEGRRGRFEKKFEELGSHIYKVTPKKENLIENLKQVTKIIKNGKYDVVHVHNQETSGLYTAIAYIEGVQLRIVHSHYAYRKIKWYRYFYNQIMKILIKKTANYYLACSMDAGKALFGEKVVEYKNFSVLHNAIDIDRFLYSESKRMEIRNQLGIKETTFVVIDVGRLTYQKNPEKAVDIFKKIHEKKNDSVFLMVGIGELESDIKKRINDANLNESVRMLGVRNDVPELLQASDAFLMPTRYEGLGIVYVEAQASGIPTFGTKERIPAEVKVCDLMHFCSENESADKWAEELLRSSENSKRKSPEDQLRKCGYDIKQEAMKLYNIYLSREKR